MQNNVTMSYQEYSSICGILTSIENKISAYNKNKGLYTSDELLDYVYSRVKLVNGIMQIDK